MIVPRDGLGVAFGTAHDGNPRLDPDVRAALAGGLGIPSDWAWPRQVHGAVVVRATTPGILGEADAIVTTSPEIPVAVSVADCLPIALVADGAAAMVRAGWRGTVAGVVPATVEVMTAAGHPPTTAVIGPGIGPCCFEVGPEVSARFPDATTSTTWGMTSVDLTAAVEAQIPGIEVITVGDCTHHDDGYHSFRRTGTELRQFGVAWLTRP